MSSKSLNKVFLIGNLTRDPDVKVTPSGASVCTFSIATNSRYKKPDGNYEELTNFHNIVAWSKLAEICGSKLKRGSKVYVEGELRSRVWEDAETNKKIYKTEVRITEMIIMKDASGKEDSSSEESYSENIDDSLVDVAVDDLPI